MNWALCGRVLCDANARCFTGSDEELHDLKKAYVDHEGDMTKILDYVLFSNPTDEPRFGEILRKWIDDEEVPAFNKFLKEPASKKLKRKQKVLY